MGRQTSREVHITPWGTWGIQSAMAILGVGYTAITGKLIEGITEKVISKLSLKE